jgi:hypothetical protein
MKNMTFAIKSQEITSLSLHSGSLSLTRYRCLHAQKSYALADLNKKLKVYQVGPVVAQGVHQETIFGWVRPTGMDEQEEIVYDGHWDMSDCQIEIGYLLRFRVEKRKVPRQLFQLLLKEELDKKVAEQEGKPLSRAQKKQIINNLKEQLTGCCLPAVKHVDAVWRTTRNDILLFSTSTHDRQLFEKLFMETFSKPLDFSIIMELPPILAMSEKEWQGTGAEALQRETGLQNVIPMEFAQTV